MKDGLRNQKILTPVFILIAILLFAIPVVLSSRKPSDSEETAAGKAYVEEQASREPAQIMTKINEAGENQAPAEEQQVQTETQSPDAEDGSGMDAEQPMEQPVEQPAAETAPVDISQLQEQINTLNIRPLSEEEIASYRQRLASSQFVGDSMTQAIYDYGLLDGDHVWFVRGAAIGELGNEVQSAVNMLPSNIVFFTGANSVDYYPTAQEFTDAYKNICSNIMAQRPDMKIYVCSVLPVSEAIQAAREDLTHTYEYDQALREMCGANGFTYVDINWMVRQELYLEDGIHFNSDFYQIWIQYIASVIGV